MLVNEKAPTRDRERSYSVLQCVAVCCSVLQRVAEKAPTRDRERSLCETCVCAALSRHT